jgi:hypothetical protein
MFWALYYPLHCISRKFCLSVVGHSPNKFFFATSKNKVVLDCFYIHWNHLSLFFYFNF